MSRGSESQAGLVAFLIVFGVALPVLAIAAWNQALDFDPCANIFAKPGQCIQSGVGIAGGGTLVAMLGIALAVSALSGWRAGRASFLAALAIGWLGLWCAVIGAAMFMAGGSMP